jgi:DNA polymerase I-like protein with 3'-5' exonuclease and polymerase domains
MQIEAKPAIATRVGELVVEAMEEAGRHFNFRIPITGEAKTGANWKETH